MAERVREVMDPNPVAVSPDTPVADVIRILRQHGLQGVPVVDADRRVVGIVTESDLVIPDPEGDLHLPHYLELFGGIVFLEPFKRFEEKLRKAFAQRASDLMTPNPDTVRPDTPVAEAARLVHRSGHNRLPVVDKDGRLVGVVTRVDLLGALVES